MILFFSLESVSWTMWPHNGALFEPNLNSPQTESFSLHSPPKFKEVTLLMFNRPKSIEQNHSMMKAHFNTVDIVYALKESRRFVELPKRSFGICEYLSLLLSLWHFCSSATAWSWEYRFISRADNDDSVYSCTNVVLLYFSFVGFRVNQINDIDNKTYLSWLHRNEKKTVWKWSNLFVSSSAITCTRRRRSTIDDRCSLNRHTQATIFIPLLPFGA